MDITEAIETGVEAAVAADTGSGGLRNATGDQYLLGNIKRAGHPDVSDTPPFMRYTIVPRNQGMDNMAQAAQVRVRFDLFSQRDLKFTKPNAIMDRLVTVLRTGTFTATGWNFSRPEVLRSPYFRGTDANLLIHALDALFSVNA